MKRGLVLGLIALTACIQRPSDEYDNRIYISAEEQDASNMNRIIDGWSASGKLLTANTDKSVTLQKIFPDTGNYTIQFGTTLPTNTGIVVEIAAEINWKVAGNQLRRLISVAQGTEITAPAQAVDVRVFDDTSANLPTAGTEYGVTINIAKGTRFGGPVILRGVPNGGAVPVILPGGSDIVTIPQNAGVIAALVSCVSATNVAPPAVTARITQFGGIGSDFFVYDPTVLTGFVPIVPGATNLVIENLSAADNIRRYVTFQIDG